MIYSDEAEQAEDASLVGDGGLRVVRVQIWPHVLISVAHSKISGHNCNQLAMPAMSSTFHAHCS